MGLDIWGLDIWGLDIWGLDIWGLDIWGLDFWSLGWLCAVPNRGPSTFFFFFFWRSFHPEKGAIRDELTLHMTGR